MRRETIETFHPRRLILAGFGGALTASAKVGDVIVARDVIDEAGDIWPCTGNTGRVLTVNRMIATVEEKLALGLRFQADVCDMESTAVAEICRDSECDVHRRTGDLRHRGAEFASDARPVDRERPGVAAAGAAGNAAAAAIDRGVSTIGAGHADRRQESGVRIEEARLATLRRSVGRGRFCEASLNALTDHEIHQLLRHHDHLLDRLAAQQSPRSSHPPSPRLPALLVNLRRDA